MRSSVAEDVSLHGVDGDGKQHPQVSFCLSGTSCLFSGAPVFTMPFYSWSVSSVAQSCPTLCDPMDCSMPGLPVHCQLPEPTQTHIHQVSGAIQPSHSLPFYKWLFFQLSLGGTYSSFVLNAQSRNWISWQQATHEAPAAAASSPPL